MKRFHVALAVADVEASIQDYTRRLGVEPELVVPGRYALWRTAEVNLSVRHLPEEAGTVRELGWEDTSAPTLSIDYDINGLVWERFSPADQRREIAALWPPVANGTG
ncbi:hypothetical protein QWY84_10065 [Aquisalimonas lutea]|uniref:hypothetical protein n=1 Tax=Aquisalimonas lutea TaxID=1327750 RepID=UPI0025B4D94E|nr:hypothetical protein [Aquisalimonas lutea]MDN3517956.1 hypothetical protein [Aquisalimonas lutea]